MIVLLKLKQLIVRLYLVDITKIFSHLNASIQMMSANISSDYLINITIKTIIKINNIDCLQQISSSLLTIPDIKIVEQIMM